MPEERPNFANPNPKEIEEDAIRKWESETQKTLYPAQPEWLFINQISYWLTIFQATVQYTGEQNLVSLADGINLDKIGELFQAPRLVNSKAETTLEFTLSEAPNNNFLIPQGTRVGASGGAVVFVTKYDAFVRAFTLSTQVEAQAEQAGDLANGFTPGEITRLLSESLASDVDSVINLETSRGGNDTEPDSRYRERLKLAASLSSTAGAESTYRYHAFLSTPSVVDIQIERGRTATPELTIYVLADYGIPTDSDLNRVETALNDNNVRPLTDELTIAKPSEITYSIDLEVTAFSDVSDTPGLEQQIQNQLADYVERKGKQIKANILRSQILSAAWVAPQVYDIKINSPAQDIILNNGEWAGNQGIAVAVTGFQPR